MHPDIKLMLGWNLIETTTTGISFDLHNGKAITGIFPDPGVCGDQSFFNKFTVDFRISDQVIFFFFRLGDYVIQFIFLYLKIIFSVGQDTLEPVDLFRFCFQYQLKFTDAFFGQLNFKALDFYFLGQ